MTASRHFSVHRLAVRVFLRRASLGAAAADEAASAIVGTIEQQGRASVLFAAAPSQNEFLMQFTADVTGTELIVADVPESSPLGAALAGRLGLEIVRSMDKLATLPRSTHTYWPNTSRDQFDAWYAGWQAAVKRVL